MTEAEWRAGTEPTPMLAVLWGKASDRKLRLFAVACCRRQWHLLTDEGSRAGVEVAERFADGTATDQERRAAKEGAVRATWIFESGTPRDYAASAVCCAIDPPVGVDAGAVASYTAVSKDDPPAQAALLREVFGNPFRPVTLDPRWQTETVVALATGIYADRAFDRMPILADALEEAGCDHADILTHCRGDGPHVRGCWVIDLVLGGE